MNFGKSNLNMRQELEIMMHLRLFPTLVPQVWLGGGRVARMVIPIESTLTWHMEMTSAITTLQLIWIAMLVQFQKE